MRSYQGTFLVLAASVFCLCAGQASGQEAVPLPVRKVVLYKNGMGYFEHQGPIKGQQAVEISLPRAQMNDVLKSLTVIDMGGGQVAGVTYDSAAPLDRRLGELPIDLSQSQNLVGFLNQVRGAPVKIQSAGGLIAGRLMGAELRTRTAGSGTTIETVEASVLSSTGELKLVELASAGALQFTDTAFATDMFRYLDLLSTRNQRDVRKLRIQTLGAGERQLYVSYTSESPIWKTTYRIVIDPNRKPLLQGWAIVDNTTPMDWVDVTLSLVAGAPVSFIQNLSQPIYARRPVIPLPAGVQVQPQLHEGTIEVPTGEAAIGGSVLDPSGGVIPGADISVIDPQGVTVAHTVTSENGSYRVAVPPGTYRLVAQAPGFRDYEIRGIQATSGRVAAINVTMQVGSKSETVAVQAGAAGRGGGIAAPRSSRDDLSALPLAARSAAPMELKFGDAIRQQVPTTAQAQALGEQFEYKLSQPVTIRRNESGLLPIVHAEVEGEKVSLYNAASAENHPRLAVWLKNTSALTLDAGAFTVIDTSSFAGEGLVETIQPGESRLLSYALDLGVEVSSTTQSERQRVEQVEISHGVMRMHSKMTEKKTYLIRNNDQKVRTIVLEHPVRQGWTLVQTQTPAESSANYYRFKLEAKPKSTTELTVRAETPQLTSYGISNITPEQITVWLKEKSIDPEIEKALSAIMAKKAEINDLTQKAASLAAEQSGIFSDQTRVRDNLQRLGRTTEEEALRQRYVRQLNEQENRLGEIKTERTKIDSARTAAQKQLDEMIEKLTLDRLLKSAPI